MCVCALCVLRGQHTGHLGDVLAFAGSVSHKRLSVARLEGEHRLAKCGRVDEDAVLRGVDDVSPPETVQRYVERGVIFPFALRTHRHVVLMEHHPRVLTGRVDLDVEVGIGISLRPRAALGFVSILYRDVARLVTAGNDELLPLYHHVTQYSVYELNGARHTCTVLYRVGVGAVTPAGGQAAKEAPRSFPPSPVPQERGDYHFVPVSLH